MQVRFFNCLIYVRKILIRIKNTNINCKTGKKFNKLFYRFRKYHISCILKMKLAFAFILKHFSAFKLNIKLLDVILGIMMNLQLKKWINIFYSIYSLKNQLKVTNIYFNNKKKLKFHSLFKYLFVFFSSYTFSLKK